MNRPLKLPSETLRSLAELQEYQKKIDSTSFRVGGSEFVDLTDRQVIQHDLLHLVKLCAKLAHVCDCEDHNLPSNLKKVVVEVIPDLLIYALQLANAASVDLGECYAKRMPFVLTKLGSNDKNRDMLD